MGIQVFLRFSRIIQSKLYYTRIHSLHTEHKTNRGSFMTLEDGSGGASSSRAPVAESTTIERDIGPACSAEPRQIQNLSQHQTQQHTQCVKHANAERSDFGLHAEQQTRGYQKEANGRSLPSSSVISEFTPGQGAMCTDVIAKSSRTSGSNTQNSNKPPAFVSKRGHGKHGPVAEHGLQQDSERSGQDMPQQHGNGVRAQPSKNNRQKQKAKNRAPLPVEGQTGAKEHGDPGAEGGGRRRRNNRGNGGRPREGDGRPHRGGRGRGIVGGGRTFNGNLTSEREADEEAEVGTTSTVLGEVGTTVQCLSTTLAKRLTNSSYECMICCDKVRPRHATWQCDNCWAVFHIWCVKKWARSSVNEPNARWRCPGCQHTRAATPSHYLCFCGAERDPEPARGCTPHSCGKICGRNRGPHCPHTCPLPCHPGPCPPCTTMAPEQFCFCGRLSYQPRCGADFDPVEGIKSCGSVCGEVLGCGLHKCEQPCHAGLCPPCAHEEQQLCYCGQHTRVARCGDGKPELTFVIRQIGDPAESVTGYYSCGEICGEELDCGSHTCSRPCHPRSDPSVLAHGECLLDPTRVSACHCGKKSARDFDSPRTACTDPVPSCGAMCARQLPGCSHTCNEICHAGPCPPCTVRISSSCGCGGETFQMECHKARSADERPRCQRLCTKKRVCRRHQCSARCCASDHVDIDGVVVPSELIAPGATDPHQCTLPCGRLLRCKIHNCTEPCHRGACPPCRNTSFEELACPCGRTRLFPPVPCGTTLPPCHHPCQRTRECGHFSLITHECHPDTVSCAPCSVLVAVRCMCGAREMKNVPCHRSHAASCGSICNKMLPCGGHRCTRSCHRPDEPCLRGQPCKQPCGKPRKSCGHPCPLACHSPAMCDESRECETPVNLKCACGRVTAQEMCGASSANSRSAQRTLACNDICKIAERNRRLALAFDLQDRAEAPLSGLVRATYSDDLLRFARANLQWVRDIETKAAAFVGDHRRAALNFAPMKQAFRAFLHALGPFYGCRSQSVDREPQRSVCWDRRTHSTIPSILLSNAIRYARAPQIICSDQINAANDLDSEFDDSASHDFDRVGSHVNSAADRLRKRIDYLSIQHLRHGLTADELGVEIDKLLPGALYTVRWVGPDMIEMYCSDIEFKNENLLKWEAMLKAKLPILGVAGLVKGEKSVTPASAAAPSAPTSNTTSPWCRKNSGGLATNSSANQETFTTAAVAAESATEASDNSVPDNWESLNV
ncbi:FKBP12-associated protein [Coemansia sp. RSA 1365]|nr:FKBP12-associated protein [Coemansia sp. RSA 1365]